VNRNAEGKTREKKSMTKEKKGRRDLTHKRDEGYCGFLERIRKGGGKILRKEKIDLTRNSTRSCILAEGRT